MRQQNIIRFFVVFCQLVCCQIEPSLLIYLNKSSHVIFGKHNRFELSVTLYDSVYRLKTCMKCLWFGRNKLTTELFTGMAIICCRGVQIHIKCIWSTISALQTENAKVPTLTLHPKIKYHLDKRQ